MDVEARPAEPGARVRTFLIADVRGYTAFTREHGDAAAARLAKKFADLARDAVGARGGQVIELRGDEALAVFDSAAQAVRAAVEFQATCLEEIEADPSLPLTVGIGIDSGEAVPVEDGFRGVALNTAARLCSKAVAGQVLVTRGLAEAATGIDDVRFEDRGTAELKGFVQPVELIEAIAPKRTATAPPERPSPEGALPPDLDPVTPMVGRDDEIRWLRGTWRQARRGNGRLVFVSGRAGIGKTRLVAALAAEASATGTSITYAGGGGSAAADAKAAIAEARATRPTLVVLDDLDAVADTVGPELAAALDVIVGGPALIVGLVREPDAQPALASVVERSDSRGDGHRILGPLGPEEIREIAHLYVGEETTDLPLESMARASGGVPSRVHEVVGEWARDEASRRLEAAAEWLAAGRDRRASDLDFANNVIGLKLGRLYAAVPRGAPDADVCPYKGLVSFEEADAPYFFGRERLVGELCARLVQAGLLGVVGSSGSGKSSLVFGGVLPSLRAGLLPGSGRWRQASMRPGEHPMEELRAALGSDLLTAVDGLDASSRLVFVVDQFEEVFTQCRDEDERAAFVEEVTDAAVAAPDRLAVILTIRGDFYGRCADSPELARLLAANQVLVGAMGRDELRRAIELPARRVGLRVESALAEALVDEVADEPGGLPLLSTALVELWQARDGGWLRLEAHEATGGVHGAVARLAEAAFEHLDTPQREAARAILLRLTAAGEGEAVTRRRVPVSELDIDRNPVMASVLTRLTEDRLLTRGDSTVEVAHEALLREWPRLQAWLREDVQGRMLSQQVTQAAREWGESGREQSGLYRGARLSAALDWSSRHGRELNELEQEFLGASQAAGEREAVRQRRTNRRLRGLLAGVAVFLVVALVAGGLALVQRSHARRAATQAEHAATAADAQRLGAQAQVQKNLDLSLLLAKEGVNLDDSVATRSNLLAALLRSPSAVRVLHPLPGRLLSVAIAPDGKALLVGNNQAKFGLLDARTHRVTGVFTATAAFFSGDGSRLGTIDEQGAPADPVQVRVRDVATGAVTNLGRIPAAVAAGEIFPPAFTPDLRRMVIAYASSPFPDPTTPAKAVVFDSRTMRPIARLTSAKHPIEGSAVSQDGQDIAVVSVLGRSASSTRLISVWSTSDLNRPVVSVRMRHGITFALGFSSDDSTLAAGSGDGSVSTISIPDGHVLTFHGRHNSTVQRVGFTPDDRTIVSTGDDSQVLVWDARTGELTHTLTGENGRIFGPAFSPDGGTVYTGGLDGALFEWDISGGRSLGRTSTVGTPAPEGSQYTVAASPDGRYLAFLGTNGSFLIRDARTLRLLHTIHTGLGGGIAVAFSPDSRLVATETHLGDVGLAVGRGYRVALWDPSNGHHVADLHGPARWVTVGGQRFPNDVETLAFNDRGTVLAGGDDTGRVSLWNIRTHRPAGPPLVVPPDRNVDFNGVLGVAWSPGDRLLAVAHGSLASVWSFARHRWLFTVDVDGGFGRSKAVAFSPDGRLLVTGGGTGVVEFWDAHTGKPSAATPGGTFGRTLHANDCWIDTVTFSPDGRTLLASGCDGNARLYDVASRQEIGTPLQGPGNVHNESVFSPDGRRVIVHYYNGTAYIWDVSPSSWERRACSVAGRSLTVSEWQQFLPDRTYRKVCRA